jgi:hypothetical protein
MNSHESGEHVQLFRRRSFAPPAKHEVNCESGVEWKLVRPSAPGWAIFLLAVLFVAGCAWAAKEGNWTGLGGLVLGVLGVGLMRWKGLRDHPAVEVIAKLSDDGQTVTFPLAGIEWSVGDLRQMALRDVSLERSNYSVFSGPLDLAFASGFNDHGRLWTCIYILGEKERELIFSQPWDIGNLGMKKALRAFCEAVEIPLLEPDLKRHGPSVISI